MPGCECDVCLSADPKNKRLRASAYVEFTDADGKAVRILIDTTPDLRTQALRDRISGVEAVLYTHIHSDHVNGIDDLRQIVFLTHRRVPVWASGETQNELISRFGYAFVQPDGSSYPPICDLHTIPGPATVAAAGGARMTLSASEDASQPSVLIACESAQQAGTLVSLQNESGLNVLAYAPSKPVQTLLLSSPELKTGGAYSVLLGGSSTGTQQDGLYLGGSTSGASRRAAL